MGLQAALWAVDQHVTNPYSRLTLIVVALYVNDETGYGFASQQTIADAIGVDSTDDVRRYLNYLHRDGLIARANPVDLTGRQAAAYQAMPEDRRTAITRLEGYEPAPATGANTPDAPDGRRDYLNSLDTVVLIDAYRNTPKTPMPDQLRKANR